MSDLKIKICGMKNNVAEVAALQPDYLGFIFYEKSPRNYEETSIPKISEGAKKVGVFVDASISFVIKKIKAFKLDVIQLHGDESAFYINDINQNIMNLVAKDRPAGGVDVWKVFSVGDNFDFSRLSEYEKIVDKFLFDTKGKEKGGNGFTFDWSVLENYPSTKPFILSGGIGLAEISEVKKIQNSGLPIHGIDVNSKFELKPGLKDISALKKMKEQLAQD